MSTAILLVTSCRWYATARLAISLADTGSRVDVLCPRGHPVTKTKIVHRVYDYQEVLPLRSLKMAIESSAPGLVVPCDDQAAILLHRLHANCRLHPNSRSVKTRELIERSLGNPESYPAFTARSTFLRRARDAGVPVPDTTEIPDAAALRAWFSANGFPAYLKADGTSGGVGVKLALNLECAEHAYARLSRPPRFIRVLKRCLINDDASFVLPWLRQTRSVVSIQKVIRGTEANSAIACWNGRLLACLNVQVLERRGKTGPATVIRVLENAQMHAIAEKVAACFGLSGLFGLDYILEEDTGVPYLIEFNGRATQTCHLNLGVGRNPAAALAGALAGVAPDSVPLTACDTIALFPQEWKRDPASVYLRTAFHDVPWACPRLLRDCMKRKLHERQWLSYESWAAFWETASHSPKGQIPPKGQIH